MFVFLINERERDFFYGLLVPLILTVPFLIWSLDLSVEALFYDAVNKAWTHVHSFPWEFLYKYAHWLLILTIAAALILLVLSFFKERYKKYRIPILFYFAALAFGPGYLVNSTMKEYWGRPRPREVIEFDGTKEYLAPFQLGIPGNGQSFPSGHASTGFSFFALALAFRQFNRKWSTRIFYFAILFGLLMGIGRNIQGGHFPTDVIWAGATCWLSASFLYHFVFFRESEKRISWKGKTAISIIVLFMLFQLFFLTAYFKVFLQTEELDNVNTQLVLSSPGIPIAVDQVGQGKEIDIDVVSQGFGITNVKLKEMRNIENNSIGLHYYFDRFILYHNSSVHLSVDTSLYLYSFPTPDSVLVLMK